MSSDRARTNTPPPRGSGMVAQSKYGYAWSNVEARSRLHSVIMIRPPSVLGGTMRTIVTALSVNWLDACLMVWPLPTGML